jgi:hypothetical protein
VQEVFWNWSCYTALDRPGRLSSWLLERFGKEVLEETHRRYLFGSLEVGGRLFEVFWHLSLPNNLHTAALLEVRREGDRLKRTGTQTWLHALPDWREAAPKEWTQTIYGLNQLTLFRGKEQLTKPLRIVEGYRTAIVCSIYFPEFVWLAASSVQGLKQYNYRTLEPLKAFTLAFFHHGFNYLKSVSESIDRLVLSREELVPVDLSSGGIFSILKLQDLSVNLGVGG